MPVTHKIPESIQIAAPQCVDGTIVSIKELHFSYPDGQTALSQVSLELQSGEKAALVGPNGAGKSTLMLHLNGILQGQGEVCIAGLPLNKENLPIIRGVVGMVFQNPDDQLFSPTVFEDVAFGPLHMGLPEEQVKNRVREALKKVEMNCYAERLSHHLSMGEKKRVAIATVLSMEPQLLAFDEPTSGLDPRARRALIDLLESMQISTLVATHDMRMVQEIIPRTIIMDGGRVIADGPTEALMADKSLLEAHGLERP
ncbi:MAG: ABC transporter ATP-binding protein [Anaerolineales bacterium]|jgi:cobalt/nickel transport system ATP-binding protein